MKPVIALVGRPNVGKSTLFNRLTRSRAALVADYPGLTRDRHYGEGRMGDRPFLVIDTGGFEPVVKEGVMQEMAKQTKQAVAEADVVIFIVDGRQGITPHDKAITDYLRKSGRPVILAVNKAEGMKYTAVVADFYELGLGSDPLVISSAHGDGVHTLLDEALKMVPLSPAGTEDEIESGQKHIKLAIVGRPNVGKSTLTNRILGEDRVVVYDMPGTTRDSIYIPMQRDEREYVLIDTAGVRKRGKITDVVEKFSVIKTLQAIEDANVVLLVIDAREGISDQDLSLLGFILNSGRSLVIVVNKWDGLSQEVKEQVKETLDYRLGFIDFARVHFISALHGSGVGNLFESVREAYDSATRRVSTAMLTRIMNMAAEDHQPPLVRGRRVKLKYAHAGGYNPPIVVIHGNQVKDLPDSYKRYLMNYFRKSLDVMGTPIRIQFKEGENPFANKRNTLTPNQMRKRKRLIKHIKKSK